MFGGLVCLQDKYMYKKLYVKNVVTRKLCEHQGYKNIVEYVKLRLGNPYEYTIFLALNY